MNLVLFLEIELETSNPTSSQMKIVWSDYSHILNWFKSVVYCNNKLFEPNLKEIKSNFKFKKSNTLCF